MTQLKSISAEVPRIIQGSGYILFMTLKLKMTALHNVLNMGLMFYSIYLYPKALQGAAYHDT